MWHTAIAPAKRAPALGNGERGRTGAGDGDIGREREVHLRGADAVRVAARQRRLRAQVCTSSPALSQLQLRAADSLWATGRAAGICASVQSLLVVTAKRQSQQSQASVTGLACPLAERACRASRADWERNIILSSAAAGVARSRGKHAQNSGQGTSGRRLNARSQNARISAPYTRFFPPVNAWHLSIRHWAEGRSWTSNPWARCGSSTFGPVSRVADPREHDISNLWRAALPAWRITACGPSACAACHHASSAASSAATSTPVRAWPRQRSNGVRVRC